jgi:hypothetical protein
MSGEGGERAWWPGPSGAKGVSVEQELQEGTMSAKRRQGENMSPRLLRVAERAKRDPKARLYSLARLIDEEALERAFRRIRKDAAVGVDGITKEEYEQNLEGNLRSLLGRMKSKRYRHQPIRRVHIPKAPGKTRPIGISCIEDKIVQGALAEVLEPYTNRTSCLVRMVFGLVVVLMTHFELWTRWRFVRESSGFWRLISRHISTA